MIGRSGGGISHFFQILHFRMSCLIFDCSIFAIFLVFTWIVEPASVEEKGGEGDQGGETTEHRPEHFFSGEKQNKRQRENKEKQGNERKKEKDSSPDSEPKLGEVSVSVREEWGGAGGGAVGGGRPFD